MWIMRVRRAGGRLRRDQRGVGAVQSRSKRFSTTTPERSLGLERFGDRTGDRFGGSSQAGRALQNGLNASSA
jgi:hypothetical protein